MPKKKLPTGPIRIDLPISKQSELQEKISSKPETVKQESVKQESSLTEYKKVAMRLSVEAVESLRQFRAQMDIPYEILVDVMVRNWDNLPKKTQAAYLKQAKQVRMNRLMVGQEKTMKTMQQKFLNQ